MCGKWNRWSNPIKDEHGNMRKEYTQWLGVKSRVGRSTGYLDVTMSDVFSNYDSYLDWAVNQKGWLCNDTKGNIFQIDKDILGDGSKYSEDFCVFVPACINSMFKRQHNTSLPRGVSKDAYKNKYRSHAHFGGKHMSFGYYDTVEEAEQVYIKNRNIYCLELLNIYKDNLDDRVLDILSCSQ